MIQRLMREKLERKRVHMANLFYYWQNILNVYQTCIRGAGRGLRSKNSVVADYKVIKAIPEYRTGSVEVRSKKIYLLDAYYVTAMRNYNKCIRDFYSGLGMRSRKVLPRRKGSG